MGNQNFNYIEKLKDPRWQKKRLEIFNRDKWKCTECGRDDLELHIHHKNYHFAPWQAPSEELRTLCVSCHTIIHLNIDFRNFKQTTRNKYLGSL